MTLVNTTQIYWNMAEGDQQEAIRKQHRDLKFLLQDQALEDNPQQLLKHLDLETKRMGLTIMKLKTLIQQKLLPPQPHSQEKKEEPPTKKRKHTSKKPYQVNRWCHYKYDCWQRENCRFKHSKREMKSFLTKDRDRSANKRIQVFVENLGSKDRLIDVNPNHCIADSLADRFRMKKRMLQGMYATRKGKIVRLWSTFRKERFKNMDILSLHQKLKGGSNNRPDEKYESHFNLKMDIEEEKENWPNFTPAEPPLFSRRTTSPVMWANQETADKSTQTMTTRETTNLELQ